MTLAADRFHVFRRCSLKELGADRSVPTTSFFVPSVTIECLVPLREKRTLGERWRIPVGDNETTIDPLCAWAVRYLAGKKEAAFTEGLKILLVRYMFKELP